MASAGMVVAQQLQLKRVVFPEPFGPIRARQSPWIDFKGYAGQGFLILEVLTEILHVNHFGHGVAPFKIRYSFFISTLII